MRTITTNVSFPRRRESRVCNFLLVLFVMISATAFADPGVIIDAKGNVKISSGGKEIKGATGAKFADGATITVDKGGSATIMFSNGSIKKLSGGEAFVCARGASRSDKPSVIRGLALAYNDAGKKTSGPAVHGMVKAAGGPRAEGGAPSKEALKEMDSDLKKVSSMGLTGDGLALMKAQVYYKYAKYEDVTRELLPVYSSQNPPQEMVKGLLAASYDKMGKPDEAIKFR